MQYLFWSNNWIKFECTIEKKIKFITVDIQRLILNLQKSLTKKKRKFWKKKI